MSSSKPPPCCGIAVLETAANPYAAVLGKPENAGIRLNLAAAFNGSAAYAAALIARYFIFSNIEYTKAELAAMPSAEKIAYLNSESAAVKGPYLALADDVANSECVADSRGIWAMAINNE